MHLLYPGSFDPPHRGHLDLIARAAACCTHLLVGVAINPDKRPYLSIDERVRLLQAECADLPQVRVVTYQGSTAAFARSQKCHALVRGLRNGSDLDHERGQAQVNRTAGGIDTLFLVADSAWSHLSASLVRQAAAADLPLDALVTPRVAQAVAAARSRG